MNITNIERALEARFPGHTVTTQVMRCMDGTVVTFTLDHFHHVQYDQEELDSMSVGTIITLTTTRFNWLTDSAVKRQQATA